MDTSKLLKRLRLAAQNPDLGIAFKTEELVALSATLLRLIEETNQAIESGKLKGEDGITPKAGSDYLTPKQQQALISQLFADAAEKMTSQMERKLSTLKSGKDGAPGADAVVTDEDIAEAARRAFEMVQLPNFEELITQEPQAIRDALELLPEGEKLALEAIEGLEEAIRAIQEEIKRSASDKGGRGSNLSSQRVRQLIVQHVSNPITVSATAPENPQINDIWIDIS